jgi:predicted ArsR family transcriptional regulator
MDRLAAVGDPELRSTLVFARAQARPVTADELAEAHGVHRNVARSRLERLVDAGLLSPAFERRTQRAGPGAGRPAKTYAVAPELQTIEFPAHRYEALVSLLVDALPQDARAETMHAVGTAFGEELARASRLRPVRTLASAAARMCDAVRRLGFQASVEDVSDTQAVIATPTCPLRPLVRERPEAAEIDRGMWAGLAARALAGGDARCVGCETHDCLDGHASCRVRLTVLPRDLRS